MAIIKAFKGFRPRKDLVQKLPAVPMMYYPPKKLPQKPMEILIPSIM